MNHVSRIGPDAEVAHVCVERLAAGDDEEHRAEDEEAAEAVRSEEVLAVERVQRGQHAGVPHDLVQPERGQRREPHERHRPEDLPDPRRPPVLHGEEPDEDDDRDGDHVRPEERGRHL